MIPLPAALFDLAALWVPAGVGFGKPLCLLSFSVMRPLRRPLDDGCGYHPPNHTRVLFPAAPRRPQHEHNPPVQRHSREDLFFQGHRLPVLLPRLLVETNGAGTPKNPSPNRRPELGARRPAHHTPSPTRAVLVEDLLGGQQNPKALQPLLDAHIYLRLKKGCQTTT